jgi:hypothetical protein
MWEILHYTTYSICTQLLHRSCYINGKIIRLSTQICKLYAIAWAVRRRRPDKQTIDFFSKTAPQISFKFDMDVSQVSTYQVCKNQSLWPIFHLLCCFLRYFSENFKNLLLQNYQPDLAHIWFLDSLGDLDCSLYKLGRSDLLSRNWVREGRTRIHYVWPQWPRKAYGGLFRSYWST